ncbi:Down syndrome cell adhesion molecule-like protein Dscam2 [Nymphon striatum]|nr:Down syndrome cell adhesion molecule-like protein Dscam2 [Nymphon striatum]
MSSSLFAVGKMIMTDTGNLLIENVERSDNLNQVKHKLSAETFLSQTSGKVIATESGGHIPPVITLISQTVNTQLGNSAQLICVARGFPPPKYQWKSGRETISTASVYIVDYIKEPGTYRFTCVAENAYGSDTSQTILVVKDLECQIDGYPVAEIRWTFNGQAIDTESKKVIISGNKMKISSLSRVDEGMYQCFVENEWDDVQAAAQIVLGEMPPYFIRKFDSKTLQPGPSVSLECVATGRPTPHISWQLNGREMNKSQKFELKEDKFDNSTLSQRYSLILPPEDLEEGNPLTLVCSISSGDSPIKVSWYKYGHPINLETGIDITTTKTYSLLQIHELKDTHTANYSCNAQNDGGNVNKTVEVKVSGPPKWINPPRDVIAAVGDAVYIPCLANAYPKPVSHWFKIHDDNRFVRVRNTAKHHVFSNGTLLLKSLKIDDGGTYRCIVSNDVKHNLQKEINVVTGKKPIIYKIKEATDDESRLILICKVTSDVKSEIKWFYDYTPVENTSLSRISMISYKGSTVSKLKLDQQKGTVKGNFSCRVENEFGKAKSDIKIDDKSMFIFIMVFTKLTEFEEIADKPYGYKIDLEHQNAQIEHIYVRTSKPNTVIETQRHLDGLPMSKNSQDHILYHHRNHPRLHGGPSKASGSRTESIIYDDSDFNLRLMAKMTPRSTLDRRPPYGEMSPRSTLDSRKQYMSPRSTLESRVQYGQRSPPSVSNFPYQQHNGSIIENNYDVPDYYSGLEPYATLELQPRRETPAENFYGHNQANV